MWGFLSEFWEQITSVGDYTIEFFENIGLAVAGAIGSLFDFLIHYISDFFVFLGWLFSAIKELVFSLILPISYIYSFLNAFISNAIKTPIEPEVNYTFTTSTLAIFNTIPYWETLSMVLGVSILIIGGIAIISLILKI